jgi:hypothetical protein
MFKSKSLAVFIAASGIAVSLLTIFQNCSKVGDPPSASLSMQSIQEFTPPEAPPLPLPPDNPESGSYKPILADRYYLDALLTDIFGPQARTVNSVNIRNDAVTFGSLCSVYENYNAYNPDTNKYDISANPMEGCSLASSNLQVAQTLANETVGRQAQINRSCISLTQNTTTVTYALAKIAAPGIPAATPENIKAAFRLFYRMHPDPDAGVIQSLQVMFPTDSASLDDWKSVLYTICISSYWQVL